MNIHDVYRPILTFFRKKRVSAFFSANSNVSDLRILDVGGDMFFWNLAAARGFPPPREIAILNIYECDEVLPAHVRWILGDAREMPIADREFDVVFSNSVIEHVGDLDAQRAMASEIRRVGKAYWVQTPDPRFPIEPHYLTPFVHWIPVALRRRLVRNLTIWGLITRPSKEEVEAQLGSIRLIEESEFRSFFPDARIIVERFCGLPKALVAVGNFPDRS